MQLDIKCTNSTDHGSDADGFNGFMAGINLADLVQLACLENRERKLLVLAGHCSGQIFFRKGEVVHCVTDKLKGEDAFYEMMSWEKGTFKFVDGTTNEHSVEIPWNFLLMEALRIKDEKRAELGKEKGLNTRVLIVDDSRFFVSRLRDFLEGQLGAAIAGEASNGREALEQLSSFTPDLITLDINMPVMAGDVALKHIMIKSPAPVVLVSNFNERHAGKIMEFLRLGAVDFVAKPMGDQPWQLFIDRLGQIVKNAHKFQVKNIRRARNPKPMPYKRSPGMPAEKMIVVLGGHGGLLEIQKILPGIDLNDRCGLLVFQQMCPLFARPAADYLAPFCGYSVKELGSGAPLLSNQAWISAVDRGWRIKSDESGAGIYSTDEGASKDFDMCAVLEALSGIYSRDLAVVVLSGADSSIVEGLQHVIMADGKIMVQRPESSLCPSPLEEIATMELASHLMLPEEMSPQLTSWISEGF